MKNFQLHKDGFRFRTGTEGEIVEISLGYQKGGTNLFNYKQEARGIYLHVMPLTLEKQENGIVIEQFTISGDRSKSGAKFFLLPLARKSAKQIETVAAKVDALAADFAHHFESNPDRTSVLVWMQQKLRELFPLPVSA